MELIIKLLALSRKAAELYPGADVIIELFPKGSGWIKIEAGNNPVICYAEWGDLVELSQMV